MSAGTLIFVKDGRTLPFVPITTAALAAIDAVVPQRRKAYARSLYMAVLEIANQERGDRAAASRRMLADRAGCSRELVTDLTPLLVEAGVVVVEERVVAGQRLENEWIVVEPDQRPAGTSTPPASQTTPPLPARPEGAASQAEQPLEDEEEGGKPPSTPLSGSPDRGVEDQLFAFWQQECGHQRALFTEERRRKVRARLKQGYTARQIGQAIRGAALAPTRNDDGVPYDDLELICRNGAKLEQFIARYEAASQGAASGGPGTIEDMAAELRSRGL